MEKYFKIAIKEAEKTMRKNEIPVGAVIVKNGKVISKAHNNRQKNKKVTGHAEINCILKAEKKLNDWRLDGCDLYVTLEPCEMCSVIIKEARISNIFFLLSQEKNVSKTTKFTLIDGHNELKDKCKKMINNFFENLRK